MQMRVLQCVVRASGDEPKLKLAWAALAAALQVCV